jgi:hypothetical protein
MYIRIGGKKPDKIPSMLTVRVLASLAALSALFVQRGPLGSHGSPSRRPLVLIGS